MRADQPTLPEVKERLTPGDLELVKKRMRVIYTLAKKNIALIHYADLNELCDLNGAFDNLREDGKLDLQAYLSSDISRQMLEILASVVRRHMLDVVDSAEFVGVLIDETLDVTSTEQMVVY